MFLTPARLARRLTRARHPIAVTCSVCYVKSRNHPAGRLRRYTPYRLGGLPVCERHSEAEVTELMAK